MLPDNWTTRDILALSLIRSITATAIRSAVEHSGSLEELFSKPALLQQCKIKADNLFSGNMPATLRDEADMQFELCGKSNVEVITYWDDTFPMLLRQISYPPALLFVRGTLEPDNVPVIGMVGTRKCTHYGQLTTERFAETFAQNGAVVCSGLANGIDMFAHKSALRAGGRTYAVIASGIDRISPHLSAKVAGDIAYSGAVISEYRCGITAFPAYFPQRNRIISGLSKAIVVVESGVTGGALITAQFAFDQNRELFAVPGNITSDKSTGTNMLIRKNMAAAALSPEDILNELGVSVAEKQPVQQHLFAHAVEQKIYEALSLEPLQIDDIAVAVAMPPQDVMSTLLMLEFKGLARQLPGKNFIRA